MLINQYVTHNRSNFLGGSDIGALLGVSKYRSAIEVWLEKTGKKVYCKDSFALRFGSFAESFIADEYSLLTSEKVVDYSHGLIHSNYSFCAGHIDRFTLENRDLPLFTTDGALNAKRLWSVKLRATTVRVIGANQKRILSPFLISVSAYGTWEIPIYPKLMWHSSWADPTYGSIRLPEI